MTTNVNNGIGLQVPCVGETTIFRRNDHSLCVPRVGPVEAIMIDTDASHDDYISEEVAEMRLKAGGQRCPCTTKICSGLDTPNNFV